MATAKFRSAGTDETGGFELWNGTAVSGTGAVSAATDQAHTGTYSVKCGVGGSAGSLANYNTPTGVCADAGRSVNCWVRFSTVSPATGILFVCVRTSGGTQQIYAGLKTNGTLAIGAAGTEIAGSTVLVANTWYHVCLSYVVVTTTNWSAVLFLNGVSETSISNTNATLAATATSLVRYGIQTAAGGLFTSTPANFSMWEDGHFIDDRSDLSCPGLVDVTAKRPIANGTATEFTTQIGAGGSGYGSGHAPQVNEVPLSATNGWSLSTTTRKTEEYTIEAAAVGAADLTGATILDVLGWISASRGSSSDSPVSRIIVDGTSTAKTLTASAAIYTQASATPTVYPAGTGTDIGMDGQYTTNPHLWSLFECGVLVAYVPATGPSSAQLAPVFADQASAQMVGQVYR